MNDVDPPPPQGSPPSGNVGTTATCCPTVSTFDGTYRAGQVAPVDARTNLPADPSGAYFEPPEADKSWHGDRMRQDDGRWASVVLGEVTELVISFEGHTSGACIANTVFEMHDSGIVELMDAQVSASGARFRVRGLAEGETTIVPVCEGKDLGWVHVVCYPWITVPATLGSILTDLAGPANATAPGMQAFLNRVWRQAGIRFLVTPAPDIDLRGTPGLRALEELAYFDKNGVRTWLPRDENSIFLPGVQDAGGQAIGAVLGATGILVQNSELELWYYSPGGPYDTNGFAPNIGFSPGVTFNDSSQDVGYGVMAHEVGHCFGLAHPDEAGAAGQVPSHLRASLGQAIDPTPVTNVEPAISARLPHRNIMGRDPLNLMGYWDDITAQLFLRKAQWDVARAGARPYAG